MRGERNIMEAPIVPRKLTKRMAEFCDSIANPGAAVYIPFLPEKGIKVYDCAGAVRQKAMRERMKLCILYPGRREEMSRVPVVRE